jgi:hypothetical protein
MRINETASLQKFQIGQQSYSTTTQHNSFTAQHHSQTTGPWAKEYAHASKTRRLQNCHELTRCCASAPERQPQHLHHIYNNRQLYTFTHLHTPFPPHDVQQASWQVHSYHTSLSQLVIFSSPNQSSCTSTESIPQHSFATGTAQQSVWWKSCNMP